MSIKFEVETKDIGALLAQYMLVYAFKENNVRLMDADAMNFLKFRIYDRFVSFLEEGQRSNRGYHKDISSFEVIPQTERTYDSLLRTSVIVGVLYKDVGSAEKLGAFIEVNFQVFALKAQVAAPTGDIETVVNGVWTYGNKNEK